MDVNFGIDFGTTNSAAIGIEGKKRIIKYTDGFDTPFPSLVVIDKMTGDVYCGRDAWNQRKELQQSCEVITSIKTYLGTDEQWNIAGSVWTPEKVAAEVFMGLKQQVKTIRKEELDSAFVAIPVGFAPEKRRALREAAEMAGINIEGFVSEPTAAVFDNYDKVRHFSKVAVFDWGGGTLDISVLENKSGRIREIATYGIKLGGDDIDTKIADWVHTQIIYKKNLDIAYEEMEPGFKDLLQERSERAKKELSYMDIAEIRLNKYGDFGAVNVQLDIDVFTSLISPEVDRAVDCMDKALKEAGISSEELGCILLVGGSINLRPFLEKIEKRWSNIIYPEEPDWTVASGAANLSLNRGVYRLAETIGLTLSDGSFFPLKKAGEEAFSDPTYLNFGVVEDTYTANFIFTDEQEKLLGYMTVPVYGFFQEPLDVEVFVDKDLVFQVQAKSRNRGEKYRNEWRYPGLTFSYELPIIRGAE